MGAHGLPARLEFANARKRWLRAVRAGDPNAAALYLGELKRQKYTALW